MEYERETYIRTLLVAYADFTTLISNMNSARAAVGLPAIGFQVTPTQGANIFGTQISSLRAGVK